MYRHDALKAIFSGQPWRLYQQLDIMYDGPAVTSRDGQTIPPDDIDAKDEHIEVIVPGMHRAAART